PSNDAAESARAPQWPTRAPRGLGFAGDQRRDRRAVRPLILLLDAHALVWWLANDHKLSAAARGAVADPANDVVVSAATIWELAIKRAAGKITLAANLSAA